MIFTERGLYGDFEMMIQDPCYEDSLFIFNDNVKDHKTAFRGAGNAVVRPYNRYGKYDVYPRSSGIPTGYSRSSGGYKTLTLSAQKEIDDSVDEIRKLIDEYRYTRIFFSAEPAVGVCRPQIATSIFKIGNDVREYITAQIYSLGE